jgi:hypothetical protein
MLYDHIISQSIELLNWNVPITNGSASIITNILSQQVFLVRETLVLPCSLVETMLFPLM